MIAIAAAPLLFTAFQRPKPELVWWTTDATQKVRPADPQPQRPQQTVHIFAARNEFEPFQIVLSAKAQQLRDVDVKPQDFRGPGGALISAENVTVYREEFVSLKKPSSVEGVAGQWPDPLIPTVDRYFGENRNAFPFALSVGRNQPLWCEVYVPRDAEAGDYHGSVLITSAGRSDITVPVTLTVWNFSLPSTSSFVNAFGFSGISAIYQHRGEYTNDEDVVRLSHVYRKSALLHRISIFGGSMTPPAVRKEGDSLTVDWASFDAEVSPFLDGTVLTENDPLPGARATSIELRDNNDVSGEAETILYYREFARHFREKGWIDRMFNYVWDEPKEENSTQVARRAALARHASADIRNLVTAPLRSDWKDFIDIWSPLVNCFERREGFKDFCDSVVDRQVYDDAIRGGKKLWWYQSCASHGCYFVGGDYFRGWPSYMIDSSGVSNRVFPWLAWKYQIQGELYFNVVEAFGKDRNPWVDINRFGGNGDGTLYYPGTPARIGGSTDIPIETIRLKLIREGLEDYEYLTLLSMKAGTLHTTELVNTLVHKTYDYERDPEKMYALRRRIGEELSR